MNAAQVVEQWRTFGWFMLTPGGVTLAVIIVAAVVIIWSGVRSK